MGRGETFYYAPSQNSTQHSRDFVDDKFSSLLRHQLLFNLEKFLDSTTTWKFPNVFVFYHEIPWSNKNRKKFFSNKQTCLPSDIKWIGFWRWQKKTAHGKRDIKTTKLPSAKVMSSYVRSCKSWKSKYFNNKSIFVEFTSAPFSNISIISCRQHPFLAGNIKLMAHTMSH